MTLARHIALAISAFALALTAAAPAGAQVPLPPLPPVGGLPSPPGSHPTQPQPPAPGPVSKAPGSVTEGVDVAHSGHLADQRLVPPLMRRWTVKAGGQVLAAGGRIYASRGRAVVALDPRNGRTLWRRPVSSVVGAMAYDGERVFARDGYEVVALAAATGAVQWRKRFPSTSYMGSPLASGGVVYLTTSQSNGYTRAYRASDGAQLWEVQSLANTFLPAIDAGRLYLVGPCGFAEARDRRDGHRIWGGSPSCSSAAILMGALHAGRLWVPDFRDSPVFAASSGQVVRRFDGDLPVFVDGLAMNQRDNRVTAVSESNGRVAWSRRGGLFRPIAIGHDVYGLASRRVTARDSETGRKIWSARYPKRGYAVPTLAAAPGLLLVENGGRLTAWESIFKPPPRGVDAGATSFDVYVRERFFVGGVIGSRLRAARPRVRIQRAGWRRGRFRAFGSARPARDGFFERRVRLRRNARLRAAVAGRHSRPFTVYAYPRVKLGRGRRTRGGRVLLRPRVRAPGTRLRGRTFVLYLARHRSPRRARRVAAGRIRGSRVRLVFRPIRHLSRRDRVYFCVRGQLKLALGRPSPLTRRCGARRIRL